MDTTKTLEPLVTAAPNLAPVGPLIAASPVLDLVIPVYNEEAGLECTVRTVRAYLTDAFPYSARLTIADNASTDGTLALARSLADELPGVQVVHLPDKGRGRALHTVWLDSDAQVLACLDVDLSTDLSALLPLVAPLVSGHSHLAIGTRLGRSARSRARPQAGGHLTLLQPASARGPCGSVLRCPVRFQGDPGRRRTRAAPPGAGHRMVLRHRVARARRTSRPAHPRGSGGLG